MRATLFYVLLWAMFVAGCVDTLTEATSDHELGVFVEPANESILPRCWFDDALIACCSSNSGGQGSGYCFSCDGSGCVSGTIP